MDTGEVLGICYASFHVNAYTNITICDKDSPGSTREASEVELIYLIIFRRKHSIILLID